MLSLRPYRCHSGVNIFKDKIGLLTATWRMKNEVNSDLTPNPTSVTVGRSSHMSRSVFRFPYFFSRSYNDSAYRYIRFSDCHGLTGEQRKDDTI